MYHPLKYATRETLGKIIDYMPDPQHKKLRNIFEKYRLNWFLDLIHRENENYKNKLKQDRFFS